MKKLSRDETLENYAARYVELQNVIRKANEELDKLREVLLEGGDREYASCVVKVTETRRFSAELAEELLPPSTLKKVSRSVVDSKLARELLPPAVYRECQKVSSTKTLNIKVKD